MSLKVLSKAMRVPLPPGQKVTLLALADCSTEYGAAGPSVATLSRLTSQTPEEVRSALQPLEGTGLIVIVGQKPGLPNIYLIDLATLDRMAAP